MKTYYRPVAKIVSLCSAGGEGGEGEGGEKKKKRKKKEKGEGEEGEGEKRRGGGRGEGREGIIYTQLLLLFKSVMSFYCMFYLYLVRIYIQNMHRQRQWFM